MREQKDVEKEILKKLDGVRPYLHSEGGDVEFIKFEDGIVYVRMLGACTDCSNMDETLKEGIEYYLSEYIPEVLQVVNVGKGIDTNIINQEIV